MGDDIGSRCLSSVLSLFLPFPLSASSAASFTSRKIFGFRAPPLFLEPETESSFLRARILIYAPYTSRSSFLKRITPLLRV